MPVRLSLANIGKYPHIRIVRSFRNAQGKPRSEVIVTYGRMDKALEKNPQAIELAKKEVARLNAEEEKNRCTVQSSRTAKALASALASVAGSDDTGSELGLNIGVALVWRLWTSLDLPLYLKKLQTSTKIRYDYPSHAFMACASRLLMPSSRLQAWKNRNSFITDFSELDDLQHYYRVLEQLAKDKESLVGSLNRKIAQKYGRSVTVCLYDVTTYAFESRTESTMRGFGMSKDHKVNEVQVVLGLVIDTNGIPIDYELYNGNTNEFGTMCPTIKRIAERYKIDKVIVVADRGLNSGENLHELKKMGCDFVIAQKVQNCDEETKASVLSNQWDKVVLDTDESGRTSGELLFKLKTLEVEREVKETKVATKSGRRYQGTKIIDTIDTHWIVTYSPKRAQKDNADLDRAIQKAQDYLDKNGSKVPSRGWKSMIKYEGSDKGRLDHEKIANRRQWAGYYAICTNIDLQKKSAEEIIELYRQLWRIEDCFRITKSDLQARPVFVWNDTRIRGHFLVCYIALVLQRLMEYECRVKNVPMTTSRMLTALRSALVIEHNIHQQRFYSKYAVNEDFEKLSELFGLGKLSRYEEHATLKTKLKLGRNIV